MSRLPLLATGHRKLLAAAVPHLHSTKESQRRTEFVNSMSSMHNSKEMEATTHPPAEEPSVELLRGGAEEQDSQAIEGGPFGSLALHRGAKNL